VAPITVGRLDGLIISPQKDRGEAMDLLEYAVLAWVESGHAVFQPAEPTEAEREAFQRTAARLLDLRERGFIQVAAAHISQTGSGHHLKIGPCVLTAQGRAALVKRRVDASAPG
jgi:hypothetical protein